MKKLGIMQPYFFPYIGYYSLIKHTDEFVLLDTVQFIRHGWIERNRVLKQNSDWLYIKVPLQKHSRDTPIKDVKIDNTKDWRNLLVSQLQPYKKKAPYFRQTMQVVEQAIEPKFDDITSLNKSTLKTVCEYLGIQRTLPIFSQMDISIEEVNEPDEWALNICKALGASEYWNPPNGQSLFDVSKYENANIDIKFQNVALDKYDQKRTPFEPGLSIIDVMMFNDIDEINNMLNKFSLK